MSHYKQQPQRTARTALVSTFISQPHYLYSVWPLEGWLVPSVLMLNFEATLLSIVTRFLLWVSMAGNLRCLIIRFEPYFASGFAPRKRLRNRVSELGLRLYCLGFSKSMWQTRSSCTRHTYVHLSPLLVKSSPPIGERCVGIGGVGLIPYWWLLKSTNGWHRQRTIKGLVTVANCSLRKLTRDQGERVLCGSSHQASRIRWKFKNHTFAKRNICYSTK